MQAIHWVSRTEEQREKFIQAVRTARLPFAGKIVPPTAPKTAKQIRYAHSLCSALAAHVQCSLEIAKRDAKAEYGVVIVCTSVVTGDRSVRLKSFADYGREEMVGFISAFEVYLTENGIPFEAAE